MTRCCSLWQCGSKKKREGEWEKSFASCSTGTTKMGRRRADTHTQMPLPLDAQTFASFKDCLKGGMVQALKLVRRRTRPLLPCATINLNHPEGQMLPVLHSKETPAWYESHNHTPYVVQITHRLQCGFGHYMLLLVHPHDGGFLFDPDESEGFFRYDVFLRQVLEPFLHIPYRGSLHRHLGSRSVRLVNRGTECSLWIAFAYRLFAEGEGWSGLRTVLVDMSPTERQRSLRAFHSDILDNRPYSFSP